MLLICTLDLSISSKFLLEAIMSFYSGLTVESAEREIDVITEKLCKGVTLKQRDKLIARRLLLVSHLMAPYSFQCYQERANSGH